MFAEKFDALMNIAEVSNSSLGHDVHINPSHIGRLRSGARPLPKKHEYLPAICRYLAEHIKKDYQINSLQKLSGIDISLLEDNESAARHLVHWLTEQDSDTSAAAGRFISGFSRISSGSASLSDISSDAQTPVKFASYLYGNAGKRKAVEQFFYAILAAEKPQTLLLFSDENMSWLYEDSAFAVRWAELFTKVIAKGNRVKIIHTVSRDLNEMLEAVTKWVPIYMTGMIEPYYYPRIRDGIFQRTVFLAPDTAAVTSSSVQQNTERMLNLFITDKYALSALKEEYELYLSLCRPLMHIYTTKESELYDRAMLNLVTDDSTEKDEVIDESEILCSAMPPLFTLPEKLAKELSSGSVNDKMYKKWKNSQNIFRANVKKHKFTLILLDTESAEQTCDTLAPYFGELKAEKDITYTKEQYREHIAHIKQLEMQYDNLRVIFSSALAGSTLLFIKENTGVILAKTNSPQTAFVIREKNMVSAFLDYTEKYGDM